MLSLPDPSCEDFALIKTFANFCSKEKERRQGPGQIQGRAGERNAIAMKTWKTPVGRFINEFRRTCSSRLFFCYNNGRGGHRQDTVKTFGLPGCLLKIAEV